METRASLRKPDADSRVQERKTVRPVEEPWSCAWLLCVYSPRAILAMHWARSLRRAQDRPQPVTSSSHSVCSQDVEYTAVESVLKERGDFLSRTKTVLQHWRHWIIGLELYRCNEDRYFVERIKNRHLDSFRNMEARGDTWKRSATNLHFEAHTTQRTTFGRANWCARWSETQLVGRDTFPTQRPRCRQ